MKQTTKQATQSKSKKIVRKTASINKAPYSNLSCDLKDSLLVVSITANLFVLTAWIALQVTTQFDGQVSSFLFTR